MPFGRFNFRLHPRAAAALWVPLLAAIALTLLNAAKPLHIDDPFIYRVAEQIAATPLDPYGFEIFWLQWPQPVYEELTPPLLPYWWAVGLRVLGEHPVLWKLWLLPFALLLCGAVHGLTRRLAPGLEGALVPLIVLSPAVLPGFNLMQDVPALALGLCGLLLYLGAADRDSLAGAAAAGLVAGLATQTKYTTVALLGLMLAHGLLFRRLRPAVLAVAVAVLVFFGWEWAITAAYGQGMFFGQVRYGQFWVPRAGMIHPLLTLVGATAPFSALLGAFALGLRPGTVYGLGAAVLAGYAALLGFAVEQVLFTVLGLGFVALLAVASARLFEASRDERAGGKAPWRTDLLLLLWLALEVAVYFAASPFPAVRRVLGIVVVGTLIFARLAARARCGEAARRVPAMLAASAVLLGLVFWWVDLREARAQRGAAESAQAAIEEVDATAAVWFVGHWGFQFYAERLGMRPVVPDVSRLEAGDWLVVPLQIERQQIRLGSADAELISASESAGFPPLRTGYGYYGGSLPLSHRPGPALTTRIYRIRHPVVPPSDWPPRRIADWARTSGGRTAAGAVPALTRLLDGSDPEGRRQAAQGLAAVGPYAAPAVAALVRALSDAEPEVRYWAALALGRIGAPAAVARPRLRVTASADPHADIRQAARDALERLGTP